MNAIHLVPVADGPSNGLIAHCDLLAARLAKIFKVNCHVHPEALNAAFAFDPSRRQYYSTAILRRLTDVNLPGTRTLGVTELDLFVPVLTFVFGEAQVGGDCALVSLHRLREEFYGLPPREDLLEERLAKEAAHELGHTFGLRHCEDWRCVMASTHSVEYLDVKGAGFCSLCVPVVTPAMPSSQPVRRL